ncbi:hypothetical protein SERLA73DRAFT_127703 [Serpula lacrymans var. lacrymans S7.3]|uniref:Uncharacterized protein n=1 Tax=Serpula lacrymans var. lacrymans (strain S7.3) TaxID=936435 RepID=F8QHN5_SERL3|nr:hypothetical protein SERLA73DRAFT_127703 [Serpula lacrymans var. lacrymans S7.3]
MHFRTLTQPKYGQIGSNKESIRPENVQIAVNAHLSVKLKTHALLTHCRDPSLFLLALHQRFTRPVYITTFSSKMQGNHVMAKLQSLNAIQ